MCGYYLREGLIWGNTVNTVSHFFLFLENVSKWVIPSTFWVASNLWRKCTGSEIDISKYGHQTIFFCIIYLAEKNLLIFLQRNSILLHSGLNPAWHFWLSTRFSCCLKMKSVENILGYIREQFYRFSRGCKPQENLNQNVWLDHATMQQNVLLHFWVIILHLNQAEIWKKYSVV